MSDIDMTLYEEEMTPDTEACTEAIAVEAEEVPEATLPDDDGERPCADTDENNEAPPLPSPELEELQVELARLRSELEQTRTIHARMAAELGEFQALFPEINVSSLPESIWEQVKSGIPLAASYALYEKKCNLERAHAAKINSQNAKMTPGAAGKDTSAEYFSPDEVRIMSQAEVRKYYQKIRESMKKWNS